MASPSEFELIRSIAATVGPARRARLGIGDDAAVIEGGGRFWLFAADMMIEDVHFSRELSSLEDVGWKALAVNISDIAAMGGLPRYATVSLGLTATDEAAGVYRGLAACARAFDVEIVGGDLVRS
ncbi:MAG TPA: AIR synthase related protein, partial [Bacillota bacterium]